MKKALSLLLVFALAFGLVSTAFAKAPKKTTKAPVSIEVSKAGVIKNFNATSVVVLENGKAVSYPINSKTKVMCLGAEAEFLEVAKKGLKVNFKVLMTNNKPQYVTFMNVPVAGLEGQGVVGIGVIDTRVNDTDSSIHPGNTASIDAITGLINATSASVKESKIVDDKDYAYESNTEVTLGDINIVPGSVKVVANGKELKVIDGKSEFDKTVVGDEVKLVLTKTLYTLVFEAPFTDKEIETQEQADEILQVAFQKKEYQITTNELSSFPVNEDVYVELNGKEVTLAKALYRGNYSYVRANSDGEAVYIDVFYKELACKIKSSNGKGSITFDAIKNNKAAFSDAVVLSPDVEIYDAKGELAGLNDAIKASLVKLTVDPGNGYKVVLIQIVK